MHHHQEFTTGIASLQRLSNLLREAACQQAWSWLSILESSLHFCSGQSGTLEEARTFGLGRV